MFGACEQVSNRRDVIVFLVFMQEEAYEEDPSGLDDTDDEAVDTSEAEGVDVTKGNGDLPPEDESEAEDVVMDQDQHEAEAPGSEVVDYDFDSDGRSNEPEPVLPGPSTKTIIIDCEEEETQETPVPLPGVGDPIGNELAELQRQLAIKKKEFTAWRLDVVSKKAFLLFFEPQLPKQCVFLLRVDSCIFITVG